MNSGRTINNLALWAGVLLLSVSGFADIIRVSPSGDDANSGASWASAKRTIGAAIAAATGTSEIWVAQGVYSERLVLSTSGVKIYGSFGGDEVGLDDRHGDWTIVDAGGYGRPLKINKASNAVLDGLTFRAGAAVGFGGGIQVISASGLTMNNCIVTNCTSASGNDGGGIYFSNGSATLTDVVVSNCSTLANGGGVSATGTTIKATRLHLEGNNAAHGGGIAMDAGGGFFDECWLVGNTASATDGTGGGGAFLRRIQNTPFTRCFFSQNRAAAGSAIDLWDRSRGEFSNNIFSRNEAGSATVLVRNAGTMPTFYNNTTADNKASAGYSAYYVSGGAYAEFRNEVVAYNQGPKSAVGRDASSTYLWAFADFWQNSVAPFEGGDASLVNPGSSNTLTDPAFLNRFMLDDPLSYALTPDSTVLDFGYDWLTFDFAGGTRPVNSTGKAVALPDKGAFEFQGMEQYVSLHGWTGDKGDGDQSNARLEVEVFDAANTWMGSELVPQSQFGFYTLRAPQFMAGSGPWTFKFSVPGYLMQEVTVDTLPAFGSPGVNVELFGGDANGDNRVDIVDLTAVMVSFGGKTADLNGDGVIDVGDLGMVLESFGMVGD